MISSLLAKLCMLFIVVISIAGASKLPWNSERLLGFALGFIFPVGYGLIWTILIGWARSGGRPGQQQSITLHTEETPAQITWAAIRSFLLLLLLFVGLLLAASLAVGVAFNIDLLNVLRPLISP